MAFIKQHFIVMLAFMLPLLLIGGLAVSIYLPSLLLSTAYDFVYATCDDGSRYYYNYNCGNYLHDLYAVENGKLVLRDADPMQDLDNDETSDVNEYYVTRLFLHNTHTNEGKEITLSEAQALNFNGLITSPDGVSVEGAYDNDADFFIFFGASSDYGYYLTKGNKRSRLNLVNEDNRYYHRDNFKFIGWVIKQ